MTLGRLIARVAIGGLFAGHGTQKLFGWFGGSGIEGTSETMHKLELRPGRQHALAAGTAETSATLLTARRAPVGRLAHHRHDAPRHPQGVAPPERPVEPQGGYEYNVAMIAAALAIVDSGPGAPSVDRALGIEKRGNLWTLTTLSSPGAAGSTLAIEAGRRTAAAEERAAGEAADGAAGRFVREGETVEASAPARRSDRARAAAGSALGGVMLLLAYAAAFWAVTAFVHGYEEPTLARRFGAEYERYRDAVPARTPRRTPGTGSRPLDSSNCSDRFGPPGGSVESTCPLPLGGRSHERLECGAQALSGTECSSRRAARRAHAQQLGRDRGELGRGMRS